MLEELKRLGRETMVYGLSTVVGRLLNVLLLPLYTHALRPSDYGVIAAVFAYAGFLNVLYGCGLDFAFMRFTKPRGEGGSPQFSTAFWSLLASSALFSGLIYAFASPLAAAAGVPPQYETVVRMAAGFLALDALCLVPFAQLRMAHQGQVYAGIKVANIAMNLILNYLFLVHLRMGVRGVFLATLITSCATLAMLAPVIASELDLAFDAETWRELLRFALPLVPAAFASMMVQVVDRPILKFLTDDATVGLYQANYRLGVFMMLVVSMFDTAWRPFFIQKAADENAPEVLSRVMTYFVLGSSFLFLAVALFIPHVVALPLILGKPLIHPDYWTGLSIVPIVTLGYLFNGIYVNLLAPVTIAKRSGLVAWATGVGALVNVAANLILIPRWGMRGAAWATLAAYAAMAGALFILGRKAYPVEYEYGRLARMAACLLLIGGAAWWLGVGIAADRVLARLGLLAAYPLCLAATGFFRADALSVRRASQKG